MFLINQISSNKWTLIFASFLLCFSSTVKSANKALDTLIGSVNETIKTVTVSSSCNINPYIGTLNSQSSIITPLQEGCEPVVATCPSGTVLVKEASQCLLDTTSSEKPSLELAFQGTERYIYQPWKEGINVGVNPYDKTKNSLRCSYNNDWGMPINWDESIANVKGYNLFCFIKLSKISSSKMYDNNGKIVSSSSLALPISSYGYNSSTKTNEYKIALAVNGVSIYYDQAATLPVTLTQQQLLSRDNYQCFTSTVTATAGCIVFSPNVKNFVNKFLK